MSVTIFATHKGAMTVMNGRLLERTPVRVGLAFEGVLRPGTSVVIDPGDGHRIRGDVISVDGDQAVVAVEDEREADVRTSDRVALDATVQYRPMLGLAATMEWDQAVGEVVANIGGLSMTTRKQSTVGEELLVEISVAGLPSARVVGVVARCDALSNDKYRLVLTFLEVAPGFEEVLLQGTSVP